jgi:hypothetical protein
MIDQDAIDAIAMEWWDVAIDPDMAALEAFHCAEAFDYDGMARWPRRYLHTGEEHDAHDVTGRVVSFSAIVSALHARGIRSYVEQTGGGCATVMVGEDKPLPDDSLYVALVGPGWFEGPGWTNARGDTADLSIGGDDVDAHPDRYVRVGLRDTEADIAEAIAWFVIGCELAS